jgi:tetratricopeptide (TPR) repeat protein
MYALQGGLSWSAFTVMSFRSAYSAMLAQDTLAVMQASVELERLAPFAPNLLLYRDLCLAYVSLARGETEAALKTYERIAALPTAHLMPAWHIDRTFHAEALMRLGRLEEAKRICEETIAVRRSQGAPDFTVGFAIQVLALIEAKLGNMAHAKQLLNALEAAVDESEAPLPIGSVHREQARLALMERDAVAFDKHFAAMLSAFRRTKNPALIQQCRKLLADAERSGVVITPSWEKHELVAPANTQELTSQAPDVTEMVEL